MGIRYTDSASKHGIANEDALYAMTHAIRVTDAHDRHGRAAKKFVGPQHAQTDRLIEVIAYFAHGDFVIFHVMETGERA